MEGFDHIGIIVAYDGRLVKLEDRTWEYANYKTKGRVSQAVEPVEIMRDKDMRTFILEVKHALIRSLLYVEQIPICPPKFTSTSKPLAHDSKVFDTPYDDQYKYNKAVL
ncbi:hypothetical protein FNV43_RR01202 [Rhamnella rubrinervis]|uniref:Uncharacterized protein n=1 Tax=Rhamnella rubrinervis TaxID=2594499 RepID=A0A8K0HQI7_9ROSA|nr:hypothetical protein FNV43_RR01202 [Rhamnella rubrinervis]